jgi:5-methylcytosine-specific restriction endonuclease McrA
MPPRPPCPEKQAAIAAGERHYFTGNPCKRGHVAKRFVSDGKCMECGAERVRQHRAENPEWWAEKDRAYREINPEARKLVERRSYEKHKAGHVEKRRASCRAYREQHRERLVQACRGWYAENRERALENTRRWQADNPGKLKAIRAAGKQARRARQIEADGRFSAADIRALESRQNGKCACCGEKRKLAVDHIVPLAKGGSNWPNNLQLLCKPCNSSKSAKDPISFMQERGRLL